MSSSTSSLSSSSLSSSSLSNTSSKALSTNKAPQSSSASDMKQKNQSLLFKHRSVLQREAEEESDMVNKIKKGLQDRAVTRRQRRPLVVIQAAVECLSFLSSSSLLSSSSSSCSSLQSEAIDHVDQKTNKP